MAERTHVGWAEAFKVEIETIRIRRKVTEIPDDFVGLAISGGGVQSATFGLGVLEALKDAGLLRKIDYLSSVGGGEYIGAWLAANCKRQKDRGGAAWIDSTTSWSDSISYLREYSTHLSAAFSVFSVDAWSASTTRLRNIVHAHVILILIMALVLLIPRILMWPFSLFPNAGSGRWMEIGFYILGSVVLAGNHVRMIRKGDQRFLKGDTWQRGLIIAVVLLASAFAFARSVGFRPFAKYQISLWSEIVVAILLIVGGFSLLPVAIRLSTMFWLKQEDGRLQINDAQRWVQWLIVVPMMLFSFMVGAALCDANEVGPLSGLSTFTEFFGAAWRLCPFPLAVVFVSLWMFSICSIRDFADLKCWIFAIVLAPFPAMLALHSLLSVIMVILHGWIQFHNGHGRWLSYTCAPPLVLYAFATTAVVLMGMMGRQSLEGARLWWIRFVSLLIIYGAGWAVVCFTTGYAPILMERLLQNEFFFPVVASVYFGILTAWSSFNERRRVRVAGQKLRSAMTHAILSLYLAGLFVSCAMVLELAILQFSGTSWVNTRDLLSRHWSLMSTSAPFTGCVLVFCCAVVLLLSGSVTDPNELSFSAFFRDRLVRCYLGATRLANERRPEKFTGFDPQDELVMASLSDPSRDQTVDGPFPIFNYSLKLNNAGKWGAQQRDTTSFTLTPHRCGSGVYGGHQVDGSVEIGYANTSTLGGRTHQPTVGQAISISAVSERLAWDRRRSPLEVFAAALFASRASFLVPNPLSSSKVQRFGLRYVFGDLFGGMNVWSSHFFITNGGNFENLGAYELIRRKCRLILMSDCEYDPGLEFHGLGRLIRLCELDFGAKIVIDASAIRADERGWSLKRSAVGSVEYQDGSRGTIVYLKACMNGKERTDILQYKTLHPDFPHERNRHECESEDQFESYRKLGREIAQWVFEPLKGEADLAALVYTLDNFYN